MRTKVAGILLTGLMAALLLAGCDAPPISSGRITHKTSTPAHINYLPTCYAVITIASCPLKPVVYAGEWGFDITNGGVTAHVNVTEQEYDSYKVNDDYPKQ